MNLEAKSMPKRGIWTLENFNKGRNGQFWTKEFGATYLCDRLSHRWLGMEGEKAAAGGYRV